MQSAAKLATTLIAPASFAAVSATLLRANNWADWGIEALPARTPSTVSFGDLANITATADCLAANTPIDGCDPYGRPFQPYVELPANILNFFNLGISDTGSLGVALAVIFLIAIALTSLTIALTWHRGLPQLIAAQALLALIAISPASMLAVERGQIEQLTLLLVVIALLVFTNQHAGRARARGYLGSITSVLATATKYLSIGMFLPFINRTMFRKENLPALIGLFASGAFVVISLPSVLLATETSGASNPQTTKSAFSVTTLFATAFSGDNRSYFPTPEVTDNWLTIRLASYALFLAMTLVWIAIFITSKGHHHRNAPKDPQAWVLTLGSGGVLLFPYLLGNSHDYRLIFLLPLAAGAILLSQTNRIFGIALAISAACAAITAAAMVPTPQGFLMPTPLLIAGDAALMVLLSAMLALWLTTAFQKSQKTQLT